MGAAAGGCDLDGPLVYIDHSDIRPGKLEGLWAAVAALVDFVEEREPQLLSERRLAGPRDRPGSGAGGGRRSSSRLP